MNRSNDNDWLEKVGKKWDELIPDLAPLVIERDGYRYLRESPVSDDEPEDPYIEEMGHRYLLEFPKPRSSKAGFEIVPTGAAVDPAPRSKTESGSVPTRRKTSEDSTEDASLPPSFLKLQKMIGLEAVKEAMLEVIDMVALQKVRRKFKLPDFDLTLNLVFTGNPGTGKTEVARLVADIYHELGVLKKGHLKEVKRKDLVAEYIGQTAPLVQKVVDEAMDGVLFIDEAYSLFRAGSGDKDFGREAIDTLVPLMENHRNNLAVIVAGYEEEMDTFLDANPGLKSRFPQTIHFEDYDPEELFRIFKFFCDKDKILLSEGAEKAVKELISKLHRNRGRDFGNARTMFNLRGKCIRRKARRLRAIKAPSERVVRTFIETDIPTEDEL